MLCFFSLSFGFTTSGKLAAGLNEESCYLDSKWLVCFLEVLSLNTDGF